MQPRPTVQRRHTRRFLVASVAVLAVAVSACGSDAATSNATSAPTTAATADTTAATTGDTTAATTGDTTAATTGDTTGGDTGVTSEGISDARCAENKAVGKITYLSSFDFAASASILDVVVAKDKGYFDAMCLDVDIKSGFSTSNYPLVAANTAQFSSAGSYTEILNYSVDGASFVALADYGKTPIEALVVKDPTITDLAQLKGKTIGVKGDIPPSIVAMLASAGLVRGVDYQETLVDGFDPVVHLQGPNDPGVEVGERYILGAALLVADDPDRGVVHHGHTDRCGADHARHL